MCYSKGGNDNNEAEVLKALMPLGKGTTKGAGEATVAWPPRPTDPQGTTAEYMAALKVCAFGIWL